MRFSGRDEIAFFGKLGFFFLYSMNYIFLLKEGSINTWSIILSRLFTAIQKLAY